MLRVSKLADYAVEILCAMSGHKSQLNAVQLAAITHIGSATVSKLLKQLVAKKLVISTRGAQGGYTLAKSAQLISVAEIVEAVDGPIAITECADDSKHCSQAAACGTKQNWQIINQVIFVALSGVSLKEMMHPLKHHPIVTKGIAFKPIINLKVENTDEQKRAE